MYLDPLYMMILVVTIALSGGVSLLVKTRFNAGQKVNISSGLTGADVAKAILMDAGITDVKVLMHQGFLSDHYNPLNKTLNLSKDVYYGRNASAAGVAAHEVGHTLVARLTDHSDPVHKVSIIPRGQALGYTLQLPTEDKFLVSKSEFLDRICIVLAGRAAEEIVFSEITSGASDDLNKAMAYARKMVMELGMSEKLGPIALPSGDEGEVFLGRDISRHNTYSPELAKVIDEEIMNLIKTSYARAKEIISSHREAFDKLVAVLLEKEVVEAKEIDEILGLAPVAPAAEQSAQASADELAQEATSANQAAPAEKPQATQGDLFDIESPKQ
jgi:ATP-dependent Zn protease